jgi:hypothetical protein
MDATTHNGPLDGIDDTDWAALAPGGADIPGLLRDIAGGPSATRSLDDAVAALFDIVRFPGPGYAAAPRVAGHLADIACHPATPTDWRSRPLSLLLELLVPAAGDVLPERTDDALWRDEVAWAAGAGAEKALDQYVAWRDEASDEQRYRRMRTRVDAVAREGGVGLLQAHLGVHDAVRERVGALTGLLEGRENRRGIDPPAEWACYVLAFVPEAAEEVGAVLRRSLAEARSGPPVDPRAMGLVARHEVLSAELFALGMLAAPDDPSATVALAHELASGHLYNSFAAAVALTVIHGERVPDECLTRIRAGGRTNVGFPGLFGDSWPHIGEFAPEALGFLALGRAGERGTEVRMAVLPGVLPRAEGAARAAVAGAALAEVFGPRAEAEPVDVAADLTEHQLTVVWTIAELPEAAWSEHGLTETLEAWGLPTDRDSFRAFAGVEDEPDATPEPAAPTTAPTPRPQSGGLFGRLFGGS